jgi:hypothetical protein
MLLLAEMFLHLGLRRTLRNCFGEVLQKRVNIVRFRRCFNNSSISSSLTGLCFFCRAMPFSDSPGERLRRLQNTFAGRHGPASTSCGRRTPNRPENVLT